MRLIKFIFLILIYSISLAQINGEEISDDAKKIPTTLTEAHAELERILPPTELAKIDAMKSEDDMIQYHFGLGMNIRNNWGLWKGSPLSKYMQEHGFTHPDDMSGVILETFWCKRHGKPFLLKERAVRYAAYWDAAKKREEEEKKRVESAKLKMHSMMMGLRLNSKGAATVKMPDRIDSSLRARFLAPYRNGVFISVRNRKSNDEFITEPYFFLPDDRMIHKVNIPDIQDFYSVVVAGQTAWFTGTSEEGSVLIGMTPERHLKINLPNDGEPPQLGLFHDTLLAVYPRVVYKLVNESWQVVYEGNISLPRSGPPPQLNGDFLYLRDEGSGENMKRLWWLKMGEEPELTSLDKDIGVVGSHGPRWENSFSHAVTNSGDLWACVGEGYARKSLLRRSKDGNYSIALMNNSVNFTPELFGSAETDQGISVSAVSVLNEDTILLCGDAGLYHLKGIELDQKLAFINTNQEIPVNEGKNIYHWKWDPSKILVLKEKSYIISGDFGGIYLLEKNKKGEWTFESLDETPGKSITW